MNTPNLNAINASFSPKPNKAVKYHVPPAPPPQVLQRADDASFRPHERQLGVGVEAGLGAGVHASELKLVPPEELSLWHSLCLGSSADPVPLGFRTQPDSIPDPHLKPDPNSNPNMLH